MGIVVGFKRAVFAQLDENDQVVADKIFTVEGKAGEGGTKEATISGLSPESAKVFASNVAYYVSQQGVGDVAIDFTILDLPEELINTVSGHQKHADGFTVMGEKSKPPYMAVLLESENAKGEPVMLAGLKGKMTMGDISLKTKESGAYEPESETMKMSCVANADGNTVGKAIGTDLVAKLRAYAFPGEVVTPAG